jgi:hypothetical protein
MRRISFNQGWRNPAPLLLASLKQEGHSDPAPLPDFREGHFP